jgi:hypothetical protein
MSRKIIPGALALGLLCTFHSALAVSVNPRGIGEALIYPYYTINKSQNTLISVVNPTEIGKAIQVRFREGYNGRDALSFVLYLAPHDVWTAAMSENDFQGATVKTSDASCTSPLFPADGVPLSSAGYDGASPAYPADGGPQDLSRTREGSIEIIVGADVVLGSATAAAITHPAAGAPSCNGLSPMSFGDLRAPTGGIFGSASVIDVGQGTFFAYNADALQGFTSTQLFSAASPLGPTLADANSTESTLGGAVAYVTNRAEQPLALDYSEGVDAVSAAFMADALYGEYLVDAGFGGNTDWVVAFPTKNFYVDKTLYPNRPTAPFDQPFAEPGVSDVFVGATVCNREQVCRTDPATAVSYQVNVLPVRAGNPTEDPSGVFGSLEPNPSMVPLGTTGAITLHLTGDAHELTSGRDPNGADVQLSGLPAVGFMAYNIVNANAQQGVLANYGGTYPFRATSACAGPAADCQ